MKSIIKKAIYTGLGLLGGGTSAIRSIGREFAKKANVSEAEGEKIARKLETQSSKAARSIRRTLDAEVTKVADAIHDVMYHDIQTKKSKPVSHKKAAKSHARKAR